MREVCIEKRQVCEERLRPFKKENLPKRRKFTSLHPLGTLTTSHVGNVHKKRAQKFGNVHFRWCKV